MSKSTAELDIQLSAEKFVGEPAAFEALFQHFHPRLVRFLTKLLGDSQVDPEDVAQESMVKAWTKRAQYDPRYRFSTWVYTIARRTAADHLRKQTRQVGAERHSQVGKTIATAPLPATREADDSLWSKAEKVLSPSQFAVLWLRYGEEMSVKEVAKSLSKSSVATRVHLHRARQALRSQLLQEGWTDAGEQL